MPTVSKLEIVMCSCNGEWEEAVTNSSCFGDATEAVVGGCPFVDGKPSLLPVSPDESVSIGELTLAECVMGDKAFVGVISADCSAMSEASLELGVSVTDWTSKSTEEVEECCVFTEWPTDCPSCTHMLVTTVAVSSAMSALLSSPVVSR